MSQEPQTNGKRRVLLVDDQPDALSALRDEMTARGTAWEMTLALGAKAALAELRHERFDAIVADQCMPGVDGASLLARVRDEHPHTVRILLLESAEPESALRAAAIAHQFLNKPCNTEALEEAVERACHLRTLITDERARRVIGQISMLPSRPLVYSTLMKRLADYGVTNAQIADVLEEDMALCAKLLQVVNSAFYGLPRRVSRIEEAVALVGHAMIQRLVLSVSIFETGSALPADMLGALQRHGLMTGNLARRMVKGTGLWVEEDAFIAGMLHDIGIVVMAARLPGHLERTIGSIQENPRPLHQAETELWGVTHAEIGAYLLALWGLQHTVVEAVAYHHRPHDVRARGLVLPVITHIADVLAHEVAGLRSTFGAPYEPLDMDYMQTLGVGGLLETWREAARSLAQTAVAA